MKKYFVVLISIILLSGSIIINSCDKDKNDSTEPVVTLIGDAKITHILNLPYVDVGAIATDDGDPIEVIIEFNNVEVNMIGTYKVIWTAIDAAGNKGSAEREVAVYNEANFLIGNYNIHVTETTSGIEYDYTDMVLVAGNVNNQIWVNKFNNYVGASVYMLISGGTLTIPNQTVSAGTPLVQRTFSGTGVVDINTGNFDIQPCVEIGAENKTSAVNYVKQ